MNINPLAPMGYWGELTIDNYGTGTLPSACDDGLPSINEVFRYVCLKLNVPQELCDLKYFTVIKMEPVEEPKILVLRKK
jgi:hypothetical protein